MEIRHMVRFLVCLCGGLLAAPQAPAANSTIYTPVTFATISDVNRKTLQPTNVVAAGNADAFVLSADESTFYAAQSGTPSYVFAIDRATGTKLHTYPTEYPTWGGLAVSANRIYVGTCSYSEDGFTCEGDNVEVFDIASGRELAVIPMAGDQITQIVIAPNGATVYVVHFDNAPCFDCETRGQGSTVPSSALTAIDAVSLQPGASYAPSQYLPQAVAITPDGRHAFLLAYEYFVGQGALYEIDLPKMTLEATIPPTGYCGEGSVALSDDGATLAVLLNCSQDQLIFIDTATLAISQTVQSVSGGIISFSEGNVYVLNGEYVDIVNAKTGSLTAVRAGLTVGAAILAPNGQDFFFLSGAASAVAVSEEGSNEVSKLLSIGGPPEGLALSPDGNTLYSAGSYPGGVLAISTVTGRVLARLVQDITYVDAVAVSSDGESVYVMASEPSVIMIINASTGALERSIDLPCSGTGGAMAMSPGGAQLYVSQCGMTTIVNTHAQAIVDEISGSSGAVAASPKGDIVYVSNGAAIEVINVATYQITGTIPFSASSIAFSPDGTKAYAEGGQNGVSGVAVIDTPTLTITGFIPGINPVGGCYWQGCVGGSEAIAVTSDGKFIVAGGSPGAVIDAQSLAIVRQFQSDGPLLVY
jgi:DNA-binding beta-propeller fold protein YncE